MRIIPPLWDFPHSEPYQIPHSATEIFPTRRLNSAVGICFKDSS